MSRNKGKYMLELDAFEYVAEDLSPRSLVYPFSDVRRLIGRMQKRITKLEFENDRQN